MKKLFTLCLLLISVQAFAQTSRLIPFASGSSTDTAYQKANLRIDSTAKLFGTVYMGTPSSYNTVISLTSAQNASLVLTGKSATGIPLLINRQPGQTGDRIRFTDKQDSTYFLQTADSPYILTQIGKSSCLNLSFFSQLGSSSYVQLFGPDNGFLMGANPAFTTPVNKVIGQIYFNAQISGLGGRTIASINAVKISDTTNRNAKITASVGSGTGSNVVMTLARNSGMGLYNIRLGTAYVNNADTNEDALIHTRPADNYLYPQMIMDLGVNQIGNFLDIRNLARSTIAKIDTGGAFTGKTVLYPQIRYATANTSLTGYDNYLYVSTALGPVTVTAPTTTIDSGQVFRVKKTDGAYPLTIQPASGLIDNQSSISYLKNEQVELHYTKPNYQSNFVDVSGDTVTTLSAFGAVADLERITIGTVASSTTITAAPGTFTSSDVGKVICIKLARSYLYYSQLHYTLTTTITAYTNSGQVEVATAPDFTMSSADAYYFTNNYDQIQAALDYCALHNVGLLLADQAGTYGIAPLFSTTAQAQSDKGFHITAPIHFQGSGKGVTNFKWSIEDNIFVSQDSMYNSAGFIIYTPGSVILSDFTAYSPDRFRTEYVSSGLKFQTYKTGLGYSIPGSYLQNNVDIIGDSAGGYQYYMLQWSVAGENSANAGIGGAFVYQVQNSHIQVGGSGYSIFSNDTSGKLWNPVNNLMEGAGSPLLRLQPGNVGNVTTGTNAFSIVTTDTAYSLYDGTSQYDTSDRHYLVQLISGTDTFNTRIDSILSPTTALLHDNAPITFTNALVYLYPISGFAEGHMMYIHPNVNIVCDNIEVRNCNKYAMHVYSGGGVNGHATMRRYNNCNNTLINPPVPGTSCEGWLIGNDNDTATTIVSNCDSFTLNEYNQAIQATFNNVRFTGTEAVFRGKSYIYAPKARIPMHTFTADTVFVYNPDIWFMGYQLGTIAMVYGGSVSSPRCYNNTNVFYFNVTDSVGAIVNSIMPTGADTDQHVVYNRSTKRMLVTAPVTIEMQPQSVTTTDATTTTIATIPLPTSGDRILLTIKMTGESGNDDLYGLKIAGIKNNAGTLAATGSVTPDIVPIVTDAALFGSTYTVTTSGTNILVRVTGLAATTINWKCYITYNKY